MKVIGFDGRTHILNPNKHARENSESASGLHKKARQLLSKCFPYSIIYEEVSLVGCKGISGNLIADFLICDIPLIVEVHGRQHYEFIKFFHKNEDEFKASIQKDSLKREWAELNSIVFIELPYNKTKEWKKIIDGHIN
jgi:hypothetical protein